MLLRNRSWLTRKGLLKTEYTLIPYPPFLISQESFYQDYNTWDMRRLERKKLLIFQQPPIKQYPTNTPSYLLTTLIPSPHLSLHINFNAVHLYNVRKTDSIAPFYRFFWTTEVVTPIRKLDYYVHEIISNEVYSLTHTHGIMTDFHYLCCPKNL